MTANITITLMNAGPFLRPPMPQVYAKNAIPSHTQPFSHRNVHIPPLTVHPYTSNLLINNSNIHYTINTNNNLTTCQDNIHQAYHPTTPHRCQVKIKCPQKRMLFSRFSAGCSGLAQRTQTRKFYQTRIVRIGFFWFMLCSQGIILCVTPGFCDSRRGFWGWYFLVYKGVKIWL